MKQKQKSWLKTAKNGRAVLYCLMFRAKHVDRLVGLSNNTFYA